MRTEAGATAAAAAATNAVHISSQKMSRLWEGPEVQVVVGHYLFEVRPAHPKPLSATAEPARSTRATARRIHCCAAI